MSEIDETAKTPKKTFWRSRQASALTVILGGPKPGEVTPESVRFTPFEERDNGDKVKVGYLETSDPRAIARLKKDSSVEPIDEDEYQKCTNPEINNNVRQLGI